jgi:hypothetical protein
MYRLLLILLMCSFSFTEEIDPNLVPCEGTCFSEEEVQNMFNNIKELQFKRETCESAYVNLESQIKDYDKLTMNYEESVRLCEVQIKIKEDMIKTIKPKWYENKYLWFFGGVVLTSGSVFLAGQIK